jgi:hypothetical protein
MVIINIILTLMTQMANSAHDAHHTFDAPAGTLLIMTRLVVGVVFAISTLITYGQSRLKVRLFLKRFGVLGFSYICAIPMIVLVANRVVPVKDRSEFVFVGVEVTKTVCNVWLMYMVSSSRSEYNKLSYKNVSFMPRERGTL